MGETKVKETKDKRAYNKKDTMKKGDAVILMKTGMWTTEDKLKVGMLYTITEKHKIETNNIRVSPAKKGLWHRMEIFKKVS